MSVIYVNVTLSWNFNFYGGKFPANRHDDVHVRVNASNGFTIRVCVPHRKHAGNSSMAERFKSGALVYSHYKRHHAQRGWNRISLERDRYYFIDDTVFYLAE